MNHWASRLLVVVALAGCAGPPPLDSNESALNRRTFIDRPGLSHSPFRTGTAVAEYFGGPVIPNPKVYVVWWGDPSGLDPSITGSGGGVDFFDGITNSTFMDWMNEYNTNIAIQAGIEAGDAGTNQRIGRGNFVEAVTLNGVVDAGTVTDAQIQARLDLAFAQGTLPAPDENTVYALYFPFAVSIDLGGSRSCQSFGAYHESTIETVRHNAYYLVLPDCGGGIDFIADSHELAEAVTDAIPTPGSNPNYPQAWNDATGSEVGDRCEAGGGNGNVVTPRGTFTVQNIWDERSHTCVVFRANPADFNISFPTNVATIPLGASTPFMVQTQTVAGAQQSLTLSVSAPSGVSAILGQTSLTSGQSTTVTVQVTAPQPTSVFQVTVRGDQTGVTPAWTHTAALLLSVDGGSVQDSGTVVDAGGGFDAGGFDAGPPDAGTFDAGTSDAGPDQDAGTADGGTGDDGGTASDGGVTPDAGTSDAGTTTPDAGSRRDAGGGTPDAGSGTGPGATGCGCGAGSSSASSFQLLTAFAALGLARIRRRRK